MAEQKPTSAADAGKGGGVSVGQTLLALLIATIIAGGVGALHGLRITPVLERQLTADAEARAREEKLNPVSDKSMLDLPPVVTNLASPADTWIRLEASILYDGKAMPHPEALVAQISGDFLAFLRTLTLEQIQGSSGLQHLRQDLNERVAIRTEGKVREVFVRTLVIQ